jgi:hypothetical protein
MKINKPLFALLSVHIVGLWVGCASSAPAPGSAAQVAPAAQSASSIASAGQAPDAGPSARDAGRGKAAKPALPPKPPRVGDIDFASRESAPPGFVCDGDVHEWGELVPGSPGAAGHVAIAFSSSHATIAGDLPTLKSGGVWIEVRFPSKDLPPIGYSSCCGVYPLNCDEPHPGTRAPLSAADKASCQATLRQYQAFSDRYEAGFRRLYRVDASGVRALDSSNKLSGISGATAGFAARQGRSQLEMVLPALALPRSSDAPQYAAQVAVFDMPETSVPASQDKARVELELPKPHDFEPSAPLRSLIFERARDRVLQGDIRLSYQPGEGLALEVVSYDKKGPIWTLASNRRVIDLTGPKLGHVELGYGFAELEGMILLVDGTAKDVVLVSGTAKVVERNGALHVVSVRESRDQANHPEIEWSVTVVSPDGTVTPVELPRTQLPFTWETARSFNNADWSQFGARGRAVVGQNRPLPLEILWGWKGSTRQYALLKP